MGAGKLTPKMEARKWKRGESGNPAGRPRIHPMSDRLAALAELPLPPDDVRKLNAAGFNFGHRTPTFGDAMGIALFRKVIATGRANIAKEIIDRIEGKANQRIELGGIPSADGGEPVQVKHDHQIDYDSLSKEELRQLEAILLKAAVVGRSK